MRCRLMNDESSIIRVASGDLSAPKRFQLYSGVPSLSPTMLKSP
jgi:hypothetical protein